MVCRCMWRAMCASRDVLVEELEEDPLGPAHVLPVRRRQLARPVVREAQALELTPTHRQARRGRPDRDVSVQARCGRRTVF